MSFEDTLERIKKSGEELEKHAGNMYKNTVDKNVAAIALMLSIAVMFFLLSFVH